MGQRLARMGGESVYYKQECILTNDVFLKSERS